MTFGEMALAHKIRIERITDSHDCETCGSTWAEGAIVYLDDEVFLEFIPIAHCYDGNNYYDDFIYAQVLAKLGYEVVVE